MFYDFNNFRMKEEFTSSAQEYRDVCYMLLGYKIDRTGHKNYRYNNTYIDSNNYNINTVVTFSFDYFEIKFICHLIYLLFFSFFFLIYLNSIILKCSYLQDFKYVRRVI